MKLYTEKEFLELLAGSGRKINRHRLHQLRSGFEQKKAGKTYFIKPKLVKGEDWTYSLDDGNPRYTEEALKKLLVK